MEPLLTTKVSNNITNLVYMSSPQLIPDSLHPDFSILAKQPKTEVEMEPVFNIRNFFYIILYILSPFSSLSLINWTV